MTEFTILKIIKVNKNEAIFRIRTDGRTANYKVNFENGRTLLSDELEAFLHNKDFNYHKEFGKIISDYKKNQSISLPIDLFKTTANQELLAA